MDTTKVEDNIKGCGCFGTIAVLIAIALVATIGSCGNDSPKQVSLPTNCDNSPSCVVTINSDELSGIDVDLELLNKQRATWKALWDQPNIKRAKITITAPTTDVGGNDSVSPILSVTCDRDTGINWNQVTPDGVKQLCDWQEKVNFG